jgi:divalent metal cation (Fe/Co/Zn/Cd) transporter
MRICDHNLLAFWCFNERLLCFIEILIGGSLWTTMSEVDLVVDVEEPDVSRIKEKVVHDDETIGAHEVDDATADDAFAFEPDLVLDEAATVAATVVVAARVELIGTFRMHTSPSHTLRSKHLLIL